MSIEIAYVDDVPVRRTDNARDHSRDGWSSKFCGCGNWSGDSVKGQIEIVCGLARFGAEYVRRRCRVPWPRMGNVPGSSQGHRIRIFGQHHRVHGRRHLRQHDFRLRITIAIKRRRTSHSKGLVTEKILVVDHVRQRARRRICLEIRIRRTNQHLNGYSRYGSLRRRALNLLPQVVMFNKERHGQRFNPIEINGSRGRILLFVGNWLRIAEANALSCSRTQGLQTDTLMLVIQALRNSGSADSASL